MEIREYCEDRYAFHPGFAKSEYVKIEIIIGMIGSGKKVLDVGSFDGTIASKIRQRGNSVVGADVVISALKLAKAKIQTVVQIPFEPVYPFKDKTFDVVFLGEVIEHVLDTDRMLQEAKRITKDDGFIIITTPNVASLGRRLMLLAGRSPYLEVSLNPKMSVPGIGHIRYFTKGTLFELLRLNDLDVLEFRSDVVNLIPGGNICFKRLALIFPGLGRSLIVKCGLKKGT